MYEDCSMVVIREMTEADVAAVSAVEEATFSMPWKPDDFLEMVQRDDLTYLVAELDGEIIGGAGLRKILEQGEITNVAVLSPFRNRGYGRKLLEALLIKGREMGVTDFTLEVRESNRPAIRLYEGLGFRYEGRRPGFYERPVEDARIYWLRGF